MAKIFARVTSATQDANIGQSLQHELYGKFWPQKKKICAAKIWVPVHRNVVFKACMLVANATWQAVLLRLLHHWVSFKEGCTLEMHPTTKSVKCTFLGAQPESDLVCVCGTCGWNRGVRPCVPLEVDTIRSWPTMGFKSQSTFNPCAARRKALNKGKHKGKLNVQPISQLGVSNPA